MTILIRLKQVYIKQVYMVVALVAVTFDKHVVERVALTGEVDLCGNVLDVGGIQEKITGAYRLGMDKFIMPQKSFDRLDRGSFSADLQSFISTKVIPVSNILQALSHCFEGEWLMFGHICHDVIYVSILFCFYNYYCYN